MTLMFFIFCFAVVLPFIEGTKYIAKTEEVGGKAEANIERMETNSPRDYLSLVLTQCKGPENTTCKKYHYCEKGLCIPYGKAWDDFPKDYPGVNGAPIDGSWGAWSEPEPECSRSCGGGIRIRRRHCDSPAPERGGANCQGASLGFNQGQRCNTLPCKPGYSPETKFPSWTSWSDWTQCSQTCGVGSQTRRRKCKIARRKHCHYCRRGDPVDFRTCDTRVTCPIKTINGPCKEKSDNTPCTKYCRAEHCAEKYNWCQRGRCVRRILQFEEKCREKPDNAPCTKKCRAFFCGQKYNWCQSGRCVFRKGSMLMPGSTTTDEKCKGKLENAICGPSCKAPWCKPPRCKKGRCVDSSFWVG